MQQLSQVFIEPLVIAEAQVNRDQLNCTLAVENLRSHGRIKFRAIGASMVPCIWPADIIEVTAADMVEINIGDVALFLREAHLCAHRVIFKSTSGLIAAGDAHFNADPVVSSTELLGRVVAVHRNGKSIDFRLTPLKLMNAWLIRRSDWFLRLNLRCHNFTQGLRQRNSTEIPELWIS